MDELIERLYRHHEDWGQGREPSFFLVCHDCKKAADALRELQAQLEQCEAIREIAALRAQEEAEKNEPLTLAELRQMDGEPVWIEYSNGARQWHIVRDFLEYADQDIIRWKDRGLEPLQDYGKTWTAYRRKPKEDNK